MKLRMNSCQADCVLLFHEDPPAAGAAAGGFCKHCEQTERAIDRDRNIGILSAFTDGDTACAFAILDRKFRAAVQAAKTHGTPLLVSLHPDCLYRTVPGTQGSPDAGIRNVQMAGLPDAVIVPFRRT